MTASTLQSVDLVQQFQNDSNSRQVDPQIASQPLNHAYPMKRDGIQHDCGAGNFRRLQQTKLEKPPNDVRMYPETPCGVFQRHQVGSSSDNCNFVISGFHFLPAMS